jgi:hypothetical protein
LKNLLIGSRALNFWFPSVKIKDSTDWDIISNRAGAFDITPEMNVEFHDPWLLNNEEFARFTTEDATLTIGGQKVYIVYPRGLAIIKRSHLHRDMKFDRHIAMYHHHLTKFTQYYTPEDEQLLAERTKMTMQLYPQANPNLMQSKEDFFDDAVAKVYDHDYLHELYAHYDKPLYTQLLREEGKAWCEQSKWVALTHDDKIKCIQEEAYVIATERFLVRNNWNYPMKLAYLKSLGKICTTLCSNWFRDYAIDHYPELVQNYNESKILQVKQKLLAV